MSIGKRFKSVVSKIDSGVGKVQEAKKDFEKSNTGKAMISHYKKHHKKKKQQHGLDVDLGF